MPQQSLTCLRGVQVTTLKTRMHTSYRYILPRTHTHTHGYNTNAFIQRSTAAAAAVDSGALNRQQDHLGEEREGGD